jgi:RNA polymerase primary sigma factor
MIDMELEKRLVAELSREPGLTARQLGAILGVYKGDVNSCLYGSPKFVRDESPRPCWSLKASKAATPSSAPTQKAISTARQFKASRKARDFDFSTLRPWQASALESWNSNKRKGLVEAVTGTGKTRLAIAAIAQEFQLGGKVAVIVPTVELQRQWFEELESHFENVQIGLLGNGNQDELTSCDVLVAIVHSASRHDLGLQDHELGLLVADECHRYGAETFRRALEDGFRSRLGLTATRERPDGAHRELELYFGSVVYSLGYEEAIRHKYIADVKVAQIAVYLNGLEREEFDQLSKGILETQIELSERLRISSNQYQRFIEEVTRLAAEGDFTGNKVARRYLALISKRKALLANTPEKLKVVKHLAPSVNNSNGTLFFTETIAGAESIAVELRRAGVSAATIHSKLDAQQRHQTFADFAAGRIKALAAARVLDEGVDVPEADLAVIISASKTRRQMIQRMGRVLRLKADGRTARFVFVYVAGTSEDPSKGAHDAFWSEVLDIAAASEEFDVPTEVKRLTKFLDPMAKE